METDPTGARTKRSFVQGNAGCVPGTAARTQGHAAIVADSCFQQLLRQELLKGREYAVEQQTSGGLILATTGTSYEVGPVDYTWAPLSGLWRAFSYTSAVDETAWEGGSTPSTKRTEYFYNFGCSWGGSLEAYGRLNCVKEFERGSLVRKTLTSYATLNTGSSYIVDRVTGTSIFNSADQYLAHSMRFYDGNNQNSGVIGTNGRLTREISVWNLQNRTLSQITNQQLDGRDTTMTYTSQGNAQTTRSYAGGGWVKWNGSV